jgi:hypothetical protein
MTLAPRVRANWTTERTVKLFPQPGPPVSTATLRVSASFTASACSGARSAPVRGFSQPCARSQSTDRNVASRSSRAASSRVRDDADGQFLCAQVQDLGGDRVLRNTEDLDALGDELVDREIAVAVVGGLGQGVGEARPDPLRAVARDADRRGDRVGGLETDPPDVSR